MTSVLSDRDHKTFTQATLARPALHAQRYIPALTGVRAVAALWVVAYHVWLTARAPQLQLHTRLGSVDFTPFVVTGWFGVDVFFVLSGFVLTQQAIAAHRRHEVDGRRGGGYGAFITRRILRVYPAYYACLTALLLFPAFRGEPWVPAPTTPDLALHLVMMHNLVSDFVSTINGVFWSLPFEWQFYLVMPLLALAVLHGRAVVLLALAIACSVMARLYVIRSGNGELLQHLPVRIDEFVVGMVAAWFMHDTRAFRHREIFFWGGFTLLLVITAYFGIRRIPWWTPDAWPTIRSWCVSGGTALMLIGLARGARIGSVALGNPVAVWFGEISYSIYLWHLPVVVYMYHNARWVDELRAIPLARPFVAVGAAIAISAASYYLVERPFHTGALSANRLRHATWFPFAILGVWALALLAINIR